MTQSKDFIKDFRAGKPIELDYGVLSAWQRARLAVRALFEAPCSRTLLLLCWYILIGAQIRVTRVKT
jgi:hypothetical protein